MMMYGNGLRNGTPSNSLSGAQNELFEQLSHPTRRYILLELAVADPGEAFSLEDSTTEIDPAGQNRIELWHQHLPKLSNAGYVEWDKQTETLVRGPRFDAVAPILKLLIEHGDRLSDE